MDLTALLPQFGNLAFTIGAFLLALMVIVAVHEYGHYIIGRLCGIGAEVFSLGFGPVLLSRLDRRGTRWQIAALPFGGYVRFVGDANAASVGGDASGHDPRHTMLGAPLWARAATVAAGPLFNFALALAIFAGIGMVQGQVGERLVLREVAPLPAAYGDGLRAGDEVLGIDGQRSADLAGFLALTDDLPAAPSLDYLVLRDGAEITVAGPHPRPPLVQTVSPRSAAYEAGLKAGDVIVAANGQKITLFSELPAIVEAAAGAPIALRVWRAGQEVEISLAPRRTDLPRPEGGFETRWLIGITGGLVLEPQTEALGLGAALELGARQVWYILRASLSGLWHMLTGAISTCNLSSPVGIAETSGAMAAQGAGSFVSFIAFLSVAVGLLNLLPIPVLDGGHLLFYAYEAVTGAPPSERALRLAVTLGLALLGTLMLTALLNDLWLCP